MFGGKDATHAVELRGSTPENGRTASPAPSIHLAKNKANPTSSSYDRKTIDA